MVIGASLAGLRAVETLRADGYTGSLAWIGAEPHLPYDRPPLSKYLLRGDWEVDRVWLRKPEEYGELGLDLYLGTPATHLDVEGQEVHLAGGERIPFDAAIVATGARPRHLPGIPTLKNVFTLRTLDDSLMLREALRTGRKLVVVGAGFIGLEIAASARTMGLEVTIVEMLQAPLIGPVGAEMAAICEALHVAHGAVVRCGVGVQALVGNGAVEGVALDSGEIIPADVVVVAIGVVPDTAWLESSSLDLGGGIMCNEFCQTSAPSVYAAGDIARWYNPRYDTNMRIEHWTNALEQGAAAAKSLLAGGTVPFSSVPYFWSDQYSARIQFAGWVPSYDEVAVVDGSIDEFSFVALYRRGTHLTGVLAFSRGRIFTRLRRLLGSNPSWEEALAQVEAQKAKA